MPYTVKFTRMAETQFNKLLVKDKVKVAKSITELITNPFPMGYKKLKGIQNLYRIRCGDHRIIYTIIEEVLIVTVIRIAHRRDAYIKIERLK